jgi:fibronectin-binding autotransporter adhesin
MRNHAHRGWPMRARGRLDSACNRVIEKTIRRRLGWILPLGAAASLLPQQALAQVPDPASVYYANFEPTNQSFGTPTLTFSAKNADMTWVPVDNNGPTSPKFTLTMPTGPGGAFPNLTTEPNGNSSASAEGGLYSNTASNQMEVLFPVGTGVAQTDTGANFNGTDSDVTYAFNAIWDLSSAYTAGSVNYQFPVGGQVGAGGKDKVIISNFTYANNGNTLAYFPSLSTTFTNDGATPETPATLISGLVPLISVKQGNFVISGTIEFKATNDQTPSYFIAPQQANTAGVNLKLETFNNAAGDDSFDDAANWGADIVPGTGGINAAVLGGAAAGTNVVYSNVETLTAIQFSSTNSYSLSPTGTGALVMQNGSTGTGTIGTAYLSVTSGGTGDSVLVNTITGDIQLASTTQVSVNADAVLNLFGAITGPGNLNITGPGTVVIAQRNFGDLQQVASNPAPVVNILGGTLQIGNGSGSGVASIIPGLTAVDNGILVFDEPGAAGDTTTNPIPISGYGEIDQDGAGTLELTGNDSGFDGSIVINNGVLQAGIKTALGYSAVTVNDAVLDLGGFSATLSALNGTGTVDNLEGTRNVSLTIANVTTSTFSGVIQNTSGTVSLVKSGIGTLDLQNDNSYSGSTTINAGTLALDFSPELTVSNILPDTNLVMAGGTLEVLPTGDSVTQTVAVTSVIKGPNAITIVNGAPVTLNLGSLNRLASSQGATVEFNGGTASTIQIESTSSAPTILAATNDNLVYSGYATYGASDWAAMSAAGSTETSYIAPGSQFAGFYTSPEPVSNGFTFQTSTAGVNVNADVNVSGLVQLNGENLTSVRFNDPTGGLTNIDGNNIDQLVLNGALINGGYLVTPNVGANNVLITPNNSSFALTQLLSPGSSAQDMVIWQNNAAGLLVLNTGIADSSTPGAGLTKAGPGTLVLNSPSSYTGPTNIEGGVVEISSNADLGGMSTSSTFGTAQLNGGTLLAVSSLTLGTVTQRNITIGSYGGGLVAATGQTLTLAGTISDSANGTGRLAFGSAGTFATAPLVGASNTIAPGSTSGNGAIVLLTTLNNFTGQIVLAGGTLQVGNGTTGGALGAGIGVITDDGNLIFNLPSGDNYNLVAPLEGIGNLAQSGAGTLTLSGFNTYQGMTTIAAGSTLDIAAVDSLPQAGEIQNNSNGTAFQTPTGAVVDNGTLLFSVPAGQTYVVTNPISGSGGVAFSAGSGSIGFSGTNSYSGATTIISGKLVVTSPNTLPAGNPVINDGTLDVETSAVTGNLSGTGSLIIGASGTASLKINANTGASSVASLTIGAGSFVDLTDNPFVITSDSGLSAIQSYLTDGYVGKWASGEIESSAVAQANSTQSQLSYSIGYADGSDGLDTVPSGEIEILPTLAGDAKLQGDVTFGDFQILAQYFGQSGTSWDEGDFNYGGATTFGDFQLLAQDFSSTSSGLTSSQLAMLQSFAGMFGDQLVPNTDGVGFEVVAVPEPASLAILAGIASATLLRRRRRAV